MYAQTLLDFPEISDSFTIDYLNKIVKSITLESLIYDIVGFSVGMVVYGIFIFHFYRFIARRDMFSFNIERRLGGGKFKATGEKISASPRIVAYMATNLLIFPIVIFVWFLVYSTFLFFLAQDMSVKAVFLVSSSIVISVRIAAYYNEELSKDLAKLLPLVLLGIFILSPTFFSIDEVKVRLAEMPNFVIQIAVFLVVAVAVEIVLSSTYLVKLKFFGHKEKKDKSSNSEQPI
ncbi:hypothetical protein [Candidatus Nitrosotenuis sp. DW1]|uniref:hypothetical protein n=1 Tax=Candidatus Nitrosotenuis sp. DW1 TaxID=2259672 RepID=UPI00210317D5|nr:hypothetical protein [Candidatus Nitrosotenuis sp. DW1]